MILFIILFVYCNAYAPPRPPLQCPVPEDRTRAWNSGKPCYSTDGCCFTEPVGNSTDACCYFYGSDGPVKCCGRAIDPIFIIVVSVFGGIALILIIIIIVLCTCVRCQLGQIVPIANIKRPVIIRDDNDIALEES